MTKFLNLEKQLEVMERRFDQYLKYLQGGKWSGKECGLCRVISSDCVHCDFCILQIYTISIRGRNCVHFFEIRDFYAAEIRARLESLLTYPSFEYNIPLEEAVLLWYTELQWRIFLNTGYIFNEETLKLEKSETFTKN